MPLASLCFCTAVVIALFGFAMGIVMGLMSDFSLVAVHAHVNFLGWVSFFLYGAFYALVPGAAEGALPRIHYGLSLVGAVLMTAGIAAVIKSSHAWVPLAAAGSFIVYAGLLTFAWIVFRARHEPMKRAR